MAKANLIGGEWVEGATIAADVNPSDLSDAVGEYAVADGAQVAVEHRTESLGALLTQQGHELRILAPTLQSDVEPGIWHATQHRNRYERRKVSTASTRRWSSGAGARPSFPKMLVTCFSTARSVTTSCSAMAWFERPSAISSSTSRSRGVRSSSGSSRRARPSSWATTSGSSADPPSATRCTARRSARRRPRGP